MNFPPDWCDAKTASYLLSMSVSTFHNNVAAGILPEGLAVGGKRLWNRRELNEALESIRAPSRGTESDILRDARGNG